MVAIVRQNRLSLRVVLHKGTIGLINGRVDRGDQRTKGDGVASVFKEHCLPIRLPYSSCLTIESGLLDLLDF
jgi:hypothetical protein